MYILQNAVKNIFRNKGRNILMAIIILAIIATSAVALIINNTSNGIIDNYKERFGSEVVITYDYQRLQEQMQSSQSSASGTRARMEIPQISAEQYVLFGESQYLQDAQYTSSVAVNSVDINPIDEELGGGGNMMSMRSMMGGRGFSGESSTAEISDDIVQYYANLFGYNFLPDEFSKDGTRVIEEGQFPEDDNECIISYDLLENSGLQIGDTITFTSSLTDGNVMAYFEDEETEIVTYDISYTLTIVGYYIDVTDEYTNSYMQNAYTNRRNEIITTVNTVISQMQEGFTGISVSAKYYLQNPDMLNSFANEIYAKGLDSNFIVTTDEASYNTIVEPVEGLKSTTFVFLIVVLVLGAVILILLSSIAIRERKYEIGVLRAMGMKKSKVAFGLLSEMVILTLVCLILGLGTGVVAAQPITNILLEQQVEQLEANNNNMNNPMGGMGNRGGNARMPSGGGMRVGGFDRFGMGGSSAEALKEMDVSMSILTIMQIIIISLLLAVISSIVGITHVTKYEPIRILSDRT